MTTGADWPVQISSAFTPPKQHAQSVGSAASGRLPWPTAGFLRAGRSYQTRLGVAQVELVFIEWKSVVYLQTKRCGVEKFTLPDILSGN